MERMQQTRRSPALDEAKCANTLEIPASIAMQAEKRTHQASGGHQEGGRTWPSRAELLLISHVVTSPISNMIAC